MTRPMIVVSRRALLLGATALAACGPRKSAEAPPQKASRANTIEAAVAGAWRTPADRARDAWRHPAESLKFWGLKPGQTVVEFWPGAGWYTDILAPFLAATGGKLYVANLEAADPTAAAAADAFARRLADQPKVYGKVEITAFGPTSGPAAPAGSADLVLFLRNLHNWMAAGIAEKAFRDAFAALKPGGYLALLLANQTEKDLPAGHGYIDHAFSGYNAVLNAGFAPERRISCPMDGAYLPQQVRRARLDGRMLGQVRDLIVARKPLRAND